MFYLNESLCIEIVIEFCYKVVDISHDIQNIDTSLFQTLTRNISLK
jgi:hypothetical protein